MRSLVKSLGPLLEEAEDMDDQLRAHALRNAKMMFYIFSEMMVRTEGRQLSDKASVMPQKVTFLRIGFKHWTISTTYTVFFMQISSCVETNNFFLNNQESIVCTA